jgi:hypothetical protein
VAGVLHRLPHRMAAERRMHVIIGGQLHGGQFCVSDLNFQVLNRGGAVCRVERKGQMPRPMISAARWKNNKTEFHFSRKGYGVGRKLWPQH